MDCAGDALLGAIVGAGLGRTGEGADVEGREVVPLSTAVAEEEELDFSVVNEEELLFGSSLEQQLRLSAAAARQQVNKRGAFMAVKVLV